MKKIYFSLITIAILLFTACTNNDVPGNQETTETGTLRATISFGGETNTPNENAVANKTRAGEASSTAVPIVSWANVKQIQLFLYKENGAIAFTKTLVPGSATNPEASDGRIFDIPNIPLGNYKLALLANASNSTDNVTTSNDGGQSWDIELDINTVVGKKISDLLVDLKEKELPYVPDTLVGFTDRKGYEKPSEIFTVVDVPVSIEGGKMADVKAGPLKREISLMRTRFDITTLPEGTAEEVAFYKKNREKVDFDTENSFIVVQSLPKYFSLADGMSAESDPKRILVAATGEKTYLDVDPPTGYKSNDGSDSYKIIDGTFTRWNDIQIFPNVTGRTGTDVTTGREYFIIISAWVDLKEGETYTYADGKKASRPQPVFWWAKVAEPFTRNVIREVNLTLKSAGYLEFPDAPTEQGGLTIEIGAPEPWNNVIDRTDMDI